jgi:hypothetical protein
MRTKISLALGKTRVLSRETALSCLTANLALPGSGSLAAGRRSGYLELLLASIGVVLTLVFGVRFVLWFAQNWNSLHNQDADPISTFSSMWMAGRWAFLGIFIFLVATCWSLLTSLQILRSARKPPILAPPPLARRDGSGRNP